MIDTLVFDLDDTLYLESEFVASGYRAVARHLSTRYGLKYEEMSDAMMATYSLAGRQAVFPMVMRRFPASGMVLSELVEAYRRHSPSIRLLPGYAELLNRLRKQYRLGILTDGLPEVQRRKITCLGLDRVVDHVVCTWDYGQESGKPSPQGFRVILEKLKSEASRAIYVGDNPDKDGAGSHAAGMKFAQVLVPGQSQDLTTRGGNGRPDFVIQSLNELPATLRRVEEHE